MSECAKNFVSHSYYYWCPTVPKIFDNGMCADDFDFDGPGWLAGWLAAVRCSVVLWAGVEERHEGIPE